MIRYYEVLIIEYEDVTEGMVGGNSLQAVMNPDSFLLDQKKVRVVVKEDKYGRSVLKKARVIVED